MDPSLALMNLLDALEDDNWPEVRNAANDLSGWIAKGGFVPPRTLERILEALGKPVRR